MTAAPAGADVKRRAVQSFAWAALSFSGSKLVVFGTTLVLARLLSPRDFGLVAAGMAIVLYLELALDLGLGAALVYEQEEGVTARVQTAATLNALATAVLSALFLLAAPLVAAFFHASDSVALFRALVGYLAFRGAGIVHDAVLQRDLRFRRRTVIEVARVGARAVVSVGLAVGGAGAWSLVWGLLAGELVGTALLWAAVPVRPTVAVDRAAVGPLLRFGLATLGGKALNAAGSDADYLVVGNRLGAGPLGIYTIAYRLPELVMGTVFWVFSTVAFPVYAKTRTVGAAAFRDTMLRALRLTTTFGFPVGVGLALVARDAVPLLFSAQWMPAATPMAVLSLALAVDAVGYASGDILPALGRPQTLLRINAGATVVLVATLVAAAPHGLLPIALVHLGFSVGYGGVRLVVAARLVDAGAGATARAMVPAVSVTAGVLLLGLPVRLLTAGGAMALAAIVGAGLVGGLLGMAAGGRTVLADLRGLARTGWRRPAPDAP